MKFRSPKFTRLRVHGVGQFVDGELEVSGPEAIRRIESIAERYGIAADPEQPFDPAEHLVAQVNSYLATADDAERQRVLEAEAAGQNRSTIVNGPHAAPED